MNDGAARADTLVGKTIRDDYRVIRRIGEGGMGAVYEAEHIRIGRRVAIKCLHPQHAHNPDIVRRFHREAQAAARIGNEHIVEVTDMGELPDGAPFFVLELLTGRSLSELAQKGPLSIGRTVHIATQICAALEAAHVAGIVHRDLKPENVFLVQKAGDPDFVKVLDFGISRFREAAERVGGASTAAGSTLGTPYYMSPEQAHGLKDIDQRVDVWALGVILYQLIGGRLPFEAESYPLLVLKIVSEQPAPLASLRDDVPPALDALVARALSKPRDDRFASMRDVALALAPFATLGEAPAMRVPLTGARLGHASSTPSLGGMAAPYEPGRQGLDGSGARPSFGVMPTPPPTSSVVPASPSSGGRTLLVVLGAGLLLAALIGVGTFGLLSTRFAPRTTSASSPAPSPSADTDSGANVTAAAPAPTVTPPPSSTVAVAPAPAPAAALAPTATPSAPAAPAPSAAPPAVEQPVASANAPVGAQAPAADRGPAPAADRGATSSARRPRRGSITTGPGTAAPLPPPITPPRPIAPAPRPVAVAPAPRPVPAPAPAARPAAAPARPPVYVGPSRTDTTGLRPDPY